MFAYIKNNSIFCVSPKSIKELEFQEIVQEEVDWEVISVEKTVTKENSDLVWTLEIEYSDEILNPVYDKKSKKIVQSFSEVELLEQKRKSKFEEFISVDSVEWFDWEWIELKQEDYSNLITLRNFWGDKWAQMAASMKKDIKDLYVLLVVLKSPKDVIFKIYEDDIKLIKEVFESRSALWLNNPDISFLYD